MFKVMFINKNSSNIFKQFLSTQVKYVQGQEPGVPGIREYFYYIDHNGMLFLDDARMKNFTSCFKDKKFLKFFFSRLKTNDTTRYKEEFPYLSLCGRERNFIRCDDLPIVFTHILNNNGKEYLSYAHAGDLLITEFQPHKIYMNPESGRVYHPAWEKVGNIGLIRSKLAIELSKYFEFEEGEMKSPTHFNWNKKRFCLDKNWVKDITLINNKML